jgi:peptidoglycan/xylan/chitin deacetylase (PgdA/CDA1 family)
MSIGAVRACLSLGDRSDGTAIPFLSPTNACPTDLLLARACWDLIVASRKCCPRVPVDAVVAERSINLTFHGIGEPGRHLPPGEADVWVSREQFLSHLDSAAGRDDVRITFDDGNASDLEIALPALRERGMTGTFFVVAGRLDASGYLDEAGVRELAAAGMEIGCHGMLHRAWRGLDDRALEEELVQSKAILEGVVARPVTRAACPFGAYDRRVLRALRRAGYEHVYTSDTGVTRPDDWLQVRYSVGPHDFPGLPERIDRRRASPTRRAKLALKRWR